MDPSVFVVDGQIQHARVKDTNPRFDKVECLQKRLYS